MELEKNGTNIYCHDLKNYNDHYGLLEQVAKYIELQQYTNLLHDSIELHK